MYYYGRGRDLPAATDVSILTDYLARRSAFASLCSPGRRADEVLASAMYAQSTEPLQRSLLRTLELH